MIVQPEVSYIKGTNFSWKKFLIYCSLLLICLALIGKKLFAPELKQPSQETVSQTFHYIGYIQTSASILGFIQVDNDKIISVRNGTHLLNQIIKNISPTQICLMDDKAIVHCIAYEEHQ